MHSWTPLLFALLPVALMLIGGTVAAYRPPSPVWRSAILHFAAGVVFSVVAVEILPDVTARHAPVEIAAGFTLGVLAMLLVRELTRGTGGAEGDGAGGLLAGIGVDVALDGLLLGIGFAAGAREGRLLALALAVELTALGLATSAALVQAGRSRKAVVGSVAVLAAVFGVSAALGITALRSLSGEALEIVLSFGLAALLFLVTEELLVEAHEEKETPLLTAAFFAGFLLFLILGIA